MLPIAITLQVGATLVITHDPYLAPWPYGVFGGRVEHGDVADAARPLGGQVGQPAVVELVALRFVVAGPEVRWNRASLGHHHAMQEWWVGEPVIFGGAGAKREQF